MFTLKKFILIIITTVLIFSLNDTALKALNIENPYSHENMAHKDGSECSKIDFNEELVSKGFKEIKLGMTTEDIKCLVGEPDRVMVSEYGFKWHVYKKYKSTFFMIGINKQQRVCGIYSNTNYNNLLNEITLDSTNINYIRNNYKTEDIINDKEEFDIIYKDGYILKLFYDIHNESTVTSYEIIKKNYFYKRNKFFNLIDGYTYNPLYNKELEASFQLQMFDLINSEREARGLSRIYYDLDRAHNSSKKHADDMKNKAYFAHENLEGISPFDRMDAEDINSYAAGENLAGGQSSAIYAHEALMNSKGHRDIILNDNFKYVGIGVDFGGELHTYYVQNYYKEY